jgi:hypothetical protein
LPVARNPVGCRSYSIFGDKDRSGEASVHRSGLSEAGWMICGLLGYRGRKFDLESLLKFAALI